MSTSLSDPSDDLQFSNSTFDLLLIELVPLAERLARAYEDSLDPVSDHPHMRKDPRQITPSTSSAQAASNAAAGVHQENESEIFRESVYFRLDSLGFRVGQGLSERFSRDRPHFTDHLDVIKFLCKDLWMVVFKKQIDNLKTNHRGVYVLTDSKFRPFQRMSMASGAEAVIKAQPHLYFPCGILRGALSNLGIKATVQAETQELPMATFQIKTTQFKG